MDRVFTLRESAVHRCEQPREGLSPSLPDDGQPAAIHGDPLSRHPHDITNRSQVLQQSFRLDLIEASPPGNRRQVRRHAPHEFMLADGFAKGEVVVGQGGESAEA